MSDVTRYSRRLTALLPAIIREFAKRETHAFARGRISVPQMLILEYLQRRRACIMRELARSLSITTSAVTGLVDRMEGAGLVRRARHPTDRRAIRIAATAKGLATIRDVLRQKERLFHAVMARLPAAQQRAYVELMETVHRIVMEQPLR